MSDRSKRTIKFACCYSLGGIVGTVIMNPEQPETTVLSLALMMFCTLIYYFFFSHLDEYGRKPIGWETEWKTKPTTIHYIYYEEWKTKSDDPFLPGKSD